MNAPRAWWSNLLLLLAFAATAQAQTAGTPAPRTVDKPIVLAARDSLVLIFDEASGDTATLYGDSKITYGEVTLGAHRIDVLLGLDLLEARGLETDTGYVGRPSFARGSETFEMDRIAFNLSTQRGRFQNARTNLDDGFLKARVVKVDEDSTAYARDGIYTTCDCVDDPSYSLRAGKLKVEDEWIYTGPIQLFLFNIPTPLWLPFGVLPNIEGRRAGPLAPQYGEDQRGFYLKDFGWYWPLSDYADLQVRGGFWTGGSWEVRPTFRYNRRYYYSGTLDLAYGNNRSGEKTDRDFQQYATTSIRWQHNQQFGQRATLNGNVNLSSTNYLRRASDRFGDRVAQTVSSSINYSTRWPTAGRSLSLSVSQQQQLQTGSVNLTLPTLNLSQNERHPFKRGGPSGRRQSLLESISYRYSGQVSNSFSFNPRADTVLVNRGDTAAASIDWFEALVSPSKYRRATLDDGTGYRFRTTHTIPVNASVQVEKLPLLGTPLRATLVPSFDYRETWYLETDRREVVDSTGRVVTTPQSGFFALRQFSTSLNANTTIYGIFPLRAGPYDGLRHTVRPTFGFSYQPDFSRPTWGYTRTYRDTSGAAIRYPIVSDVRQGEVAALTFNLDNVFETRRTRTDTTGAVRREPVTLLNLSASTAYNFAVDSLRLAPISVRARTRLFGQVDVNVSSSFSPYGYGNDASTPVFNLRQLSFARLTSLTLSASTRLASKRRGAARPSQQATFDDFVPGASRGAFDEAYGPDRYDPARQAAGLIGRAPYADFSIPWTLSGDFSYGLSRREVRQPDGTYRLDSTPRAIFNTSFDFSLTPNWKVQGRSGYDLIQKEISATNLSFLRDFECWEMSFSWIPFGRYQSYSFTLQVKSGKLRELLRLDQPRSRTPNLF